MKNDQLEKAKDLYFHTDYGKSEIARQVGVNRKTILFWSQQGNWNKLRLSARSTPSIVAEKCYYLINHCLNKLLVNDNVLYNSAPVSLKDAQTIHLLAATIKKLKNRNTVNETMELFNFFLTDLNSRDPELAALVTPQIEEYITARQKVTVSDHIMEEFHDSNGSLPFPTREMDENFEDERDDAQLNKDFEDFLRARNEKETANS